MKEKELLHPGTMLLENFLKPRKITPHQLANSIDVPVQEIVDLIDRKTGLSPLMVCKLSSEFGVRTSFWMNLQIHWDLNQSSSVKGRLVHENC